MVLGQPDTRPLVLLTLRCPATLKTTADHTGLLSEPRPPQPPQREELMPTIERTTGCSAAHGFGAAEHPVIGVTGIASPGDIKNGSRSHLVVNRAAPATASSS